MLLCVAKRDNIPLPVSPPSFYVRPFFNESYVYS